MSDKSDKNFDERGFLDGIRGLIGLDPLYDTRGALVFMRTHSSSAHGLNPGCYRGGAAGGWRSGAWARRESSP